MPDSLVRQQAAVFPQSDYTAIALQQTVVPRQNVVVLYMSAYFYDSYRCSAVDSHYFMANSYCLLQQTTLSFDKLSLFL